MFYYFWRLEFENPSHVFTTEENTDKRLSFKVLRKQGTNGAVNVHWKIVSQVEMDKDISQMEGNVGFLTGDNEATIHIDILSDDSPELNEVLYEFVFLQCIFW